MVRFFQILLVWLMVAALPAQGLAAAIKATCSSAHHGLPATMEQDGRQESDALQPHSHHRHHQHAAHDAHPAHGTAVLDAALAESGGSESSQMHSGELKASHCSACAACCVGAAAPPFALQLPAPAELPDAAPLASSTPFAGHIPSGLERPPRNFPA